MLSIFRYTAAWYKDRHSRIRSGQINCWAIAEMVCMTISLLTLAAVVGLGLARWSVGLSVKGALAGVLSVLLAGAVGYLTNLIAVTMLFRPYDESDRHPAGLVPGWRQGLIPRNIEELASGAGRQVAGRLLKPEAIANELQKLLEGSLNDPELQIKLRENLGPVMREKLPSIIDHLTPELMTFFRDALSGRFSPENVDRLFDSVIDPWLKSGGTTEELADGAVSILKQTVPVITNWLQEMAEKYRESGFWKRVKLWLAEKTVLDWEVIREKIYVKLNDKDIREQIKNGIRKASDHLRRTLKDSKAGLAVDRLKERGSDFAAIVIEEHLRKSLPEIGNRIVDNRRFWNWLATEGLPSLKPAVLAWLQRDGIMIIEREFDVAGQVEKAIRQMDVAEVHDAINDVGAKHLGAIQVLGYALGIVAGSLLLLV